MVIVEGVDNSGKSTLIYALASRLGLYSVKVASRPKKDTDVKFCSHLLRDWNYDVNGKIITDRIQVISEFIYGPICRNTSLVSQGMLDDFLGETSRDVAYPTVVVWCNPRPAFVRGSIDQREQMEGVKTNLDQLITRYGEVMEHVSAMIPVLQWDYTRTDFDDLVNAIKEKGKINE